MTTVAVDFRIQEHVHKGPQYDFHTDFQELCSSMISYSPYCEKTIHELTANIQQLIATYYWMAEEHGDHELMEKTQRFAFFIQILHRGGGGHFRFRLQYYINGEYFQIENQ